MAKIALWKLSASREGAVRLAPVPAGQALTSLNATAEVIPGGVYTTFRTFQGNKILPLEDHIRRLEESASLVKVPLTLDEATLREGLRAALAAFQAPETRLRISVDLEAVPGTVYLALEPLQLPPPAAYEEGVRVVSVHIQRENPKAKRTSFITVSETLRHRLPSEVNEALLVDEGKILEGMSSNFFAVKNEVLWTAEGEVLSGITRAMVLSAAQNLNILINFEGYPVAAIGNMEEAFITSSSRSVLPVTQIDDTRIGNGKPGAITGRIMQAYAEEVSRRLEPL